MNPPIERKVNSTMRGTIVVRDGNDQLYDPAVLQLSFNKGASVEDTLTYGGASPGDSQLTRVSVGRYAWWYRLDVVATWSIGGRWTDTAAGGRPLEVKLQQEIVVLVRDDPHTYADRTAA